MGLDLANATSNLPVSIGFLTAFVIFLLQTHLIINSIFISFIL